MTRLKYNGNLGGLAGADAKCALAAAAAGIPGTFKAWISDGSTDALSRITSDGPWFSVQRNGSNVEMTKRMFNNKANLQTQPLSDAFSWVDETGANFDGEIWTATSTGGTRRANHCTNWTSNTGQAGFGDLGGISGGVLWTFASEVGCSFQYSLLCFQE